MYSPSENEGAVVVEAAVGKGRVGGDATAVRKLRRCTALRTDCEGNSI